MTSESKFITKCFFWPEVSNGRVLNLGQAKSSGNAELVDQLDVWRRIVELQQRLIAELRAQAASLPVRSCSRSCQGRCTQPTLPACLFAQQNQSVSVCRRLSSNNG